MVQRVTRLKLDSVPVWLRVTAVLILCGLVLVAWHWPLKSPIDADELTAWLAVHRHAWYALPVVVIVFIVLGLVLFPVILLIAATGIAFGPLLGPVYAMAGCLASASTGFAIGRRLGLERINQIGGERIARITRLLNRNGTLAVFLARKVPAPFALVNVVIGASTIRFRDFMIGTVLGMGAFVVGLAGFGYQLTKAFDDPSPQTVIGAALFVVVPLTLALLINRAFRRLRPAE